MIDFSAFELPIIQAPMAGVQGGALAAAVSNAGGLGSLPCALLDADALGVELAALAGRTSRPFNLNFFAHAMPAVDAARDMAWRDMMSPYYRECGITPADALQASSRAPLRAPFGAAAADVVEAFKPAVVSFHFGLPSPDLLARVKGWGSTIVASATTVAEALWLERRGVDAIMAQGNEAGGHRGMFLTEDVTTQLGTFALLPQIIRAVRVPVIAAGGIVDARGVTAALSFGAVAAQAGTAYLLCPEATTPAVHRAALSGEGAAHTALTNLFSGRPARGIVNRLMQELGPMNAAAPAFPRAGAAVAALRTWAEARGQGDFSPLWCGENASGCRDMPAAALTRALAGL